MFIFFFFSSRRRHTRLVSDWSSDVCSSDLRDARSLLQGEGRAVAGGGAAPARQIGRASCRERGVDLGGRRIIKKKKKQKTCGQSNSWRQMSCEWYRDK